MIVRKPGFFLVLILATLAMRAPMAEGATRTWTGAGGSGLVSNGANWSSGIAPASGDQLVFDGVPPQPDVTFDISNGSFSGISFRGDGSYNLRGNPITLTGPAPLDVVSTSGAFSFFTDIHFSASGPSIVVNGTLPPSGTAQLIFYSPLVFNGGTVQVNSPSAQVLFWGGIAELAPTSFQLSGFSAQLQGNNSFSGAIDSTLQSFQVFFISGGESLGTPAGGTYVAGGRFFVSANLAEKTTSEPFTIATTVPVDANSGGFTVLSGMPLHFAGPIALVGNPTLWFDSDASFDGPIAGDGALQKYGTGTLTLTNASNSFTREAKVFNGSLRLAAPDVLTRAYSLTGYGSSTLVVDAVQTMDYFDCRGITRFTLGAGKVRVRKGLAISCSLELTIPPGLVPGQGSVFTLFEDLGAQFISGNFAGMPEGAVIAVNGVNMRITYAAGAGHRDVALLGPSSAAAAFRAARVSGNLQIVAKGTFAPSPLVARAVDASDHPVAGARVTFQTSCGDLGGASTVDVTTDASGIATAPTFRGGMSAGACAVTSRVAGGSTSSADDFTMNVYDPSTVILTPIPATIQTVVNQPFSFVVQLSVPEGFPMSGLDVRLEPQSGLANINGLLTHGLTDANGRVTGSALANNVAGNYEIAAIFGFVTRMIPVIQSAAAAPPPPATRSTTLTSPTGRSITLSVFSTDSGCVIARAQIIDPRAALFTPDGAPPGTLAFPHGLLDFRLDNCGTNASVSFVVEYPDPLPPTAAYWKYGPTPDNRTPHWYSMPGRVDGNRFTFTIVDGGLGDDDLTANGSIADMGGLAFNGGTLQDLWWSGSAENGWGMSIIQHGDMLFANVYVYDSAGRPMWLVIPGGAWNAAHTAFTGALYIPRGSPYFAYDVSRFDIGAPVGSATFTFSGESSAVFEYTINGLSGRKNITRLAFGRPELLAAAPGVGDLWWGGVPQNGWGITVLQQVRTLFALWFTYDADGSPTWYLMPGGEWTSADTYEGRMYRAVGSAWVGATYDPSQHRTIDVGSCRLRFKGDSATFEYTIDGRSGTVPLTRLAF